MNCFFGGRGNRQTHWSKCGPTLGNVYDTGPALDGRRRTSAAQRMHERGRRRTRGECQRTERPKKTIVAPRSERTADSLQLYWKCPPQVRAITTIGPLCPISRSQTPPCPYLGRTMRMRRTIRTGRASPLGWRVRKMCDAITALLCVYSLADSGKGENPSDRALRCPVGSGQECVLKLS